MVCGPWKSLFLSDVIERKSLDDQKFNGEFSFPDVDLRTRTLAQSSREQTREVPLRDRLEEIPSKIDVEERRSHSYHDRRIQYFEHK